MLLDQLKSNPNKIFLLDAYGALLSAFLLGIVLVRLESYFGIPVKTLYFLASLPILFSIYDFICYKKESIGPYLKGIASMNILYCILSIGMGIYHSETITYLGWIYLIGEVSIVLGLAIFEFYITKRLKSMPTN